jgi:hypothetical protein
MQPPFLRRQRRAGPLAYGAVKNRQWCPTGGEYSDAKLIAVGRNSMFELRGASGAEDSRMNSSVESKRLHLSALQGRSVSLQVSQRQETQAQ